MRVQHKGFGRGQAGTGKGVQVGQAIACQLQPKLATAPVSQFRNLTFELQGQLVSLSLQVDSPGSRLPARLQRLSPQRELNRFAIEFGLCLDRQWPVRGISSRQMFDLQSLRRDIGSGVGDIDVVQGEMIDHRQGGRLVGFTEGEVVGPGSGLLQ